MTINNKKLYKITTNMPFLEFFSILNWNVSNLYVKQLKKIGGSQKCTNISLSDFDSHSSHLEQQMLTFILSKFTVNIFLFCSQCKDKLSDWKSKLQTRFSFSLRRWQALFAKMNYFNALNGLEYTCKILKGMSYATPKNINWV